MSQALDEAPPAPRLRTLRNAGADEPAATAPAALRETQTSVVLLVQAGTE